MPPTISVITVTKNVKRTINELACSLANQSFREFEWVVVDGQSSDGTVEWFQNFCVSNPWVRFCSERDFGIYDAINKALVISKGEYYVVAGADDFFELDALARYSQAAKDSQADLVLADVRKNSRTLSGFYPNFGWLGPSKAFRGSHSVGMLFRTSLHEKFGVYSSRFPLLADAFFLKRLLKAKALIIEARFIAGTFGGGGISSSSKLQTLAETWQIQMLTEERAILQILLFIAKLVVKFPAVAAELATAKRVHITRLRKRAGFP